MQRSWSRMCLFVAVGFGRLIGIRRSRRTAHWAIARTGQARGQPRAQGHCQRQHCEFSEPMKHRLLSLSLVGREKKFDNAGANWGAAYARLSVIADVEI